VHIRVAKAVRAARVSLLTLTVSGLAYAATAQTVPDQSAPPMAAQLDLPTNIQFFGKADPNVRKATAIVNDAVITGTDIDQRVNLIIALNKLSLKPEERDQLRLTVLRQVIDETLQIQEAKSNDITVDPKEVDQTFARVSHQYEKTPEQFRVWLRQVGASERTIKRQIEGEMAWSRLLRRRVDISVSEAEAQEIIKQLEAQRGQDEYHVYEIYKNAGADRSEEVFKFMQGLIEQMKQGAPFDYLSQYSDSTTKSKGGDLGWVRLAPGVFPEEWSNTVRNMNPGQVAGPVQLPAGFSIIYLAEKRKIGMADPKTARLTLRQLTLNFPKGTTEAQATARATEFGQATQTMKGCGDAQNVAKTQGAEMIEKDGIVIGDLPPALQQIMIPLQVGETTRPFGSIEDGVRVLVICGRDDPPAPGTPSVEQVQDQLAEQRTNIRAQRMLRDLRRDALVEYR
jgi:peptidyl-prolyl cis-trans isomerase SurA